MSLGIETTFIKFYYRLRFCKKDTKLHKCLNLYLYSDKIYLFDPVIKRLK